MTLLQLILLIIAGTIFFIFFKQILSQDYSNRQKEYAPNQKELERQKKTNNGNSSENRLKELIKIAEKSIDEKNYLEAQNALFSALVISPDNPDILRRLGVAYIGMNSFLEAKKIYQKLIDIDSGDDLAHSSLANVLHKLGENEKAIEHHKISIELDREYAPHYYNYANTLYDLGEFEQAKQLYKKAIELDPKLSQAKEMIEKLEQESK